MKPLVRVLAASLICLPLLAQVSVPKVGTARYPDGSLHAVQGLPLNLIVADLPLDSVEAASFSDSGGFVSQNGALRLLASNFSVVAQYSAGEKPLLSIDGELTTALAWFPNAHRLIHWNGSKFDELSVADGDIEGRVTAIQSAGPRQARLLVLHADDSVSAVTISLRNGNLVTSEALPGVRGYAFGQGFFVVYASDKELVVDNLRGYRRSIVIPAQDFVIDRMSSNWLHIFSPSLQQNWALHLTHVDLELSLLPGIAAHVASSETPEAK